MQPMGQTQLEILNFIIPTQVEYLVGYSTLVDQVDKSEAQYSILQQPSILYILPRNGLRELYTQEKMLGKAAISNPPLMCFCSFQCNLHAFPSFSFSLLCSPAENECNCVLNPFVGNEGHLGTPSCWPPKLRNFQSYQFFPHSSNKQT